MALDTFAALDKFLAQSSSFENAIKASVNAFEKANITGTAFNAMLNKSEQAIGRVVGMQNKGVAGLKNFAAEQYKAQREVDKFRVQLMKTADEAEKTRKRIERLTQGTDYYWNSVYKAASQTANFAEGMRKAGESLFKTTLTFDALNTEILQYNASLASLTMTNMRLTGSTGNLNKAIEAGAKAAGLSRQQFALLADSVQKGSLGVTPSIEAIGRLSAKFKSLAVSANDQKVLWEKLSQMQNKVAGFYEMVDEATRKGGASMNNLMMLMQNLGADQDLMNIVFSVSVQDEAFQNKMREINRLRQMVQEKDAAIDKAKLDFANAALPVLQATTRALTSLVGLSEKIPDGFIKGTAAVIALSSAFKLLGGGYFMKTASALGAGGGVASAAGAAGGVGGASTMLSKGLSKMGWLGRGLGKSAPIALGAGLIAGLMYLMKDKPKESVEKTKDPVDELNQKTKELMGMFNEMDQSTGNMNADFNQLSQMVKRMNSDSKNISGHYENVVSSIKTMMSLTKQGGGRQFSGMVNMATDMQSIVASQKMATANRSLELAFQSAALNPKYAGVMPDLQAARDNPSKTSAIVSLTKASAAIDPSDTKNKAIFETAIKDLNEALMAQEDLFNVSNDSVVAYSKSQLEAIKATTGLRVSQRDLVMSANLGMLPSFEAQLAALQSMQEEARKLDEIYNNTVNNAGKNTAASLKGDLGLDDEQTKAIIPMLDEMFKRIYSGASDGTEEIEKLKKALKDLGKPIQDENSFRARTLDLMSKQSTLAKQYNAETIEASRRITEESKTMREGWLQGMKEMAFNAGQFSGLISTQKMGIPTLTRYGGPDATYTMGGVGNFGRNNDFFTWNGVGVMPTGMGASPLQNRIGTSFQAGPLGTNFAPEIQRVAMNRVMEQKSKTGVGPKGMATGGDTGEGYVIKSSVYQGVKNDLPFPSMEVTSGIMGRDTVPYMSGGGMYMLQKGEGMVPPEYADFAKAINSGGIQYRSTGGEADTDAAIKAAKAAGYESAAARISKNVARLSFTARASRFLSRAAGGIGSFLGGDAFIGTAAEGGSEVVNALTSGTTNNDHLRGTIDRLNLEEDWASDKLMGGKGVWDTIVAAGNIASAGTVLAGQRLWGALSGDNVIDDALKLRDQEADFNRKRIREKRIAYGKSLDEKKAGAQLLNELGGVGSSLINMFPSISIPDKTPVSPLDTERPWAVSGHGLRGPIRSNNKPPLIDRASQILSFYNAGDPTRAGGRTKTGARTSLGRRMDPAAGSVRGFSHFGSHATHSSFGGGRGRSAISSFGGGAIRPSADIQLKAIQRRASGGPIAMPYGSQIDEIPSSMMSRGGASNVTVGINLSGAAKELFEASERPYNTGTNTSYKS